MDTNLLKEVTRVQQDIHLIRTTIETLQARVDDLVARLQEQTHDQSFKFIDLEGMWAGADFSLETIKTAEYQIPEDLP
ncbi:MAG: hypothetical protein BroJett011_71920 [Chloroflexota bacterium]|nr:MAG: hypothetical protein BroJett011_71920 [Chloroflexota bacterium]